MKILLAIAVCLATIDVILAQSRRRRGPFFCENALKRPNIDIGYKHHPSDCTQFIECFYYKRGRVEPVYRDCRFGTFWDPAKFKCRPAAEVNCPFDKCRKPGVKHYKHSNPNKCGAYWKCHNGRSYAACCPKGTAYNSKKGCVPSKKCVAMCPFNDRIPGCDRRPIPGSPTKYYQYIGEQEWKIVDCPKDAAFNSKNCRCSETGIMVAGRQCKPELKMTFSNGIRDESLNKHRIRASNVLVYKGAAYFRGHRSKIWVPPFSPKLNDTNLVIKLRYRDDNRFSNPRIPQLLVTNGMCGKNTSVIIVKNEQKTVLAASTIYDTASMALPNVKDKKWKEIIYIHDGYQLEGRVCGALDNVWSDGPLKQNDCGFQFGGSWAGYRGFVGLLDDIYVYRCKPLDAVININY